MAEKDIFAEFAVQQPAKADPFAEFAVQPAKPAEPAAPEDPEMESWLEGIAAVETGGQADPYKARNPETSAVGKHQFIWSFWGDKSKHI